MERTLWYKSKILLLSKIKEEKRSFSMFLLSLNPEQPIWSALRLPGCWLPQPGSRVGSSCWWTAATSRVRWESCVQAGWGGWGDGTSGREMGKIQESHRFWTEIRDQGSLTQTKRANAPHASPGASDVSAKKLIFHAPRWAFSCLLVCVETDLGLMRSNLF